MIRKWFLLAGCAGLCTASVLTPAAAEDDEKNQQQIKIVIGSEMEPGDVDSDDDADGHPHAIVVEGVPLGKGAMFLKGLPKGKHGFMFKGDPKGMHHKGHFNVLGADGKALSGGHLFIVNANAEGDDEEGDDEEDEEDKDDADDDAESLSRAVVVEGVPLSKDDIELKIQANVQLSDYFIGVECFPAEDAIRKHLKLGDRGLWIEGVVDDSPAAKAGFEQGDILVSAGDTELSTVEDLVKVIGASEDSEITFAVLRGGEKLKIKVTPAKREQSDVIVNAPGAEGAMKWLERVKPGGDADIRIFRHGVITDEDKYEFPEGLKINITREGKGPAKVVVKKGDETWETDSEHLDKLPEDVRPHVERMVSGSGPFRMRLQGMPEVIRERMNAGGDVARAMADRARSEAQRARVLHERARKQSAEGNDESQKDDSAGDESAGDESEDSAAGKRLERIMARIEKMVEEKASMLEKMFEEKAAELEKHLKESEKEASESDES